MGWAKASGRGFCRNNTSGITITVAKNRILNCPRIETTAACPVIISLSFSIINILFYSLHCRAGFESSHQTASKTLLLNNVLHVPRIAKNRLSISKLTHDNSAIAEFFDDCCLVKDKVPKKVLLRGSLKDGLSEFPVKAYNNKRHVLSLSLNQHVPSPLCKYDCFGNSTENCCCF